MNRLLFLGDAPDFGSAIATMLLSGFLYLAFPIQAAESPPVTHPPSASGGSDVRQASPTRNQVQLQLAYGFRSSSQVFGKTGRPEPSDPNARWSVHQLDLSAAFGITRHTSAYLAIPVLYPILSNDVLETPLTNPTPLLGDTEVGLVWRPFEKVRPYRGFRVTLYGKTGSGHETAGEPSTTLLTGDGIPAAGLRAGVKRQLGSFWGSLELGAEARFSQVVGYAETVYADGNRGDARFHPGSEANARVALMVTPGHRLWIEVNSTAQYNTAFRLGTSQARWFPYQGLEPLEGTEALTADAGLAIGVRLLEGLELGLEGRHRFLGRTLPELAALGLESLSPPPGFSARLWTQLLW